jgi:hypothetical protein
VVKAARAYVQLGGRVVADVDLADFFDRLNHEICHDLKRLKRSVRTRMPSGVAGAVAKLADFGSRSS